MKFFQEESLESVREVIERQPNKKLWNSSISTWTTTTRKIKSSQCLLYTSHEAIIVSKVRLISITKPMIDAQMTKVSTAESLIAYTARVSNPAGQMNDETAPKLLAYLIKNKHWSPFEMVSMTVEINTSRAIAAQILRHRSFSFQELSQRYSTGVDAIKPEFITYPARRQDMKNRQNSIDDMDVEDKRWFHNAQERIQTAANDVYNEALSRGIAKEQARFLLLLSTATKLYMSGTARSWIHYIQLRTDKATQLEHREIAEGCKAIFVEQFPCTSEALGWNSES